MRYRAPNRKISSCVVWFAFLAVLTAGIAAAPVHGAAQEPASAAQPNSGAQTAGAAKSETAKSDADETDKFRHAPLVQTAAKALHLQVETTARLFELINFAIIALIIGIPLGRFLPGYIRKRSDTLRDNLESARKVTEDANSRLSAVEAKLARLDEEIAKFRADVEQESLHDEERIKAALNEESVRIVAAAEQEIGVAGTQARRTLRNFAAGLAIEHATQNLVLSPETDKALIAEFAGEMAKGGQN